MLARIGVGTEAVLRAPPDGYTLLCAAQLTFSVTHLLFSKASFDPRALEPISVLATYPLILIARADLPFDRLQDLIAYAQVNPGKINYGHQGKGQTGHLLGELLMLRGKGFQQSELRARILALEADPLASTPQEMRELIRQSLETWGPVVEAANIRVE